jgi:hypothetical protein
MGAIFDGADSIQVDIHEPRPAHRATTRIRGLAWFEALCVALSPALVALVLRLRLMAPSDLPDPAMHTTYVIDPGDVFTRFAAAYAATDRLREGARVGFLVPARLAYLIFGAVPGFFVLRYVLALVAVVPVYLLLRRLYGRPAGLAGVLIVLSSPVIVTAWGTDYPDSAVVSYVAGAMACLAMPSSSRWRPAWLAAAGTLLITAVWSHGVAVPLVAATLVGYVGVRLVRERTRLAGDLAVLGGVALAVTGLLIVASKVVLGRADFISTTWQAYRYLSSSGETAAWHSSNWRWAPNVAYLLVPPVVLGVFAVAAARRGRSVPTPALLIGVVAAIQFAIYAWLQFFGTVQTLEEHYFSSTLWASVCLALAVALAELARPLSDRPIARWLPCAVLLAVPLGYEAYPHVPSFGWAPVGFVLAAVVIGAGMAARACGRLGPAIAATAATGLALAVMLSALLVLSVAPIPRHPQLPGVAGDDPAPAYASALGGSGAAYIDNYRIAAELPLFVGRASYRGEQILIWWPISQSGFPNQEYAGMYHALFNTLYSDPPDLTLRDRRMLWQRRPAELLLFDRSAAPFPTALRELASFRPTLLRTATLRSGPWVLHAWLIRLDRYYRGRTVRR